MAYDPRNLCVTKRAKVPGPLVRQWCVIGHAIDPWANGGRTWAWDHRWADGHCRDCHRTLDDILVTEREKARATATMVARGCWEAPC